jgi:hypothetical protein
MAELLVDRPANVAGWSVPVIVDAVRPVQDWADSETYEMVRGVYFLVDVVDLTPVQVRSTLAGGQPVPALLVGGAAIIIGPVSGAEEFRHARDLAETFDAVERDENLVEIADVWLPMRWLADVGDEVVTGDVFRIGERAFRTAYTNQAEGLPVGNLLEFDLQDLEVVSSEVETAAFRGWQGLQVQRAIEQYPKDERLELRWEEAAG